METTVYNSKNKKQMSDERYEHKQFSNYILYDACYEHLKKSDMIDDLRDRYDFGNFPMLLWNKH